jgi:hypothetical protein
MQRADEPVAVAVPSPHQPQPCHGWQHHATSRRYVAVFCGSVNHFQSSQIRSSYHLSRTYVGRHGNGFDAIERYENPIPLGLRASVCFSHVRNLAPTLTCVERSAWGHGCASYTVYIPKVGFPQCYEPWCESRTLIQDLEFSIPYLEFTIPYPGFG